MANFYRRILYMPIGCCLLTALAFCQSPRYMDTKDPKAGYQTHFLFFKARIPRSKHIHGHHIRVSLGEHLKVEIMARKAYRIYRAGSKQHIAQGTRKLNMPRLRPNTAYKVIFSDRVFQFNGKAYRGELLMHTSARKIHVINRLPVEDYLYGVVPSEMSASWHVEALKAQATAARTYAYKRMQSAHKAKKSFDVDGSTASQVYKGLAVETPKVRAAVDATAGKILTMKGQPINAFFYSSCGGYTEEAHNVWGSRDPSTQTRKSPYCRGSKTYAWKTYAGASSLNRLAAKIGVGKFKYFKIRRRSKSGRAILISVYGTKGKRTLRGNDFRLKLGAQTVRSLRFKAKRKGSGVIFAGRGWGHGVGMCQYGAKRLAETSKDHEDILRYFYNDVNITRMKGSRVASR